MKSSISVLFILCLNLVQVQANEIRNENNNTNQWTSLHPVNAYAQMRDPFSEPVMSTPDDMQSNLGMSSGFGMGFQRGRGDFEVPELLFKGFIDRGDEKAPIALLQVGSSKVHLVSEGDQINIDPAQPRNAIRIAKITRLSITVETGMLGTVRVLK